MTKETSILEPNKNLVSNKKIVHTAHLLNKNLSKLIWYLIWLLTDDEIHVYATERALTYPVDAEELH